MAVIRQPEAKDLLNLTRYAVECSRVHEEGEELFYERKYWAADHLFGNDERQQLLIADHQGEMIGYIFGTVSKKQTGWIGVLEEIFVDEFYRREGVGTELYRHLMNWMKDQQVHKIEIRQGSSGYKAEGFFRSLSGKTGIGGGNV